MPYLILSAATLLMSFSGIGATLYNRKNAKYKGTMPIYNLITLFTVFICWFVKFLLSPETDASVIVYSVIFTAGYSTAIMSSVYAYKEGPMLLTSLIMQLSLISTTIWGFFFWNSEVTAEVIIGLILVVIVLFLCLYTGKENAGEKKKITLKWIFFITLFFVGNSVCTITQRTQQLDFKSQYGDFFMAVATAISFTIGLITFLKSDKKDTKAVLKDSWYIPLLVGFFNFLQNLFVLLMATMLSANIVYPVLMIGCLAITSIFSIFIFKESMRWWQWLGVLLGACAIALLC